MTPVRLGQSGFFRKKGLEIRLSSRCGDLGHSLRDGDEGIEAISGSLSSQKANHGHHFHGHFGRYNSVKRSL